MSKKSKTQYANIGALSLRPMSGYEMKKMMAGSTNHFWSESNGQIYPTLAKLAKDKLAKLKTEMVGTKERKVYQITSAGRKKLKDWLLEAVEHYPARNELLLKLFYSQNISKSQSIKHIKQHAEDCKKMLELYSDIEKRLIEKVKNGERSVYFLVTVLAGTKLVRTEIDWCKDSIKLINQYAK